MFKIKNLPTKKFISNGFGQNNKLEEVIGDLHDLKIFNRVIKKTFVKDKVSQINYYTNHTFLNSIKFMLFLQSYNIVPKIYYIDYDEQSIYMQYCGDFLTNEKLNQHFHK